MVKTLLLLHWLWEFCFGPLFSNLVLDALSRSAIIVLKNMAGCFTLYKLWLSVFSSHGAISQSITVTFPGHIRL